MTARENNRHDLKDEKGKWESEVLMSGAGKHERRFTMLNTLAKRGSILTGVICIVIFALSFIVAGCGGERDSKSEIVYRTVREDPGTNTSGSQATKEATVPTESFEDELAAIEEEVKEEKPREVTYEEAEAAYLGRDYPAAVELFTIYTENRSENPWGYYMLGLSAWKAGEYEKAQGAFQLALDHDPKHVKSWLNLGRVYLDTDRPQEALECIEKAVTVDSESNVAYRLKGRAFHQLGQREDAIDAYRMAIVIDGSDAWAMNNLALILIEQERFDEALKPLARAVELETSVAIFQNNLGMALERNGYYRAAEKAYDAALTIEYYDKASVNFERIAVVDEEAGLGALDLAALAISFKEEIDGMKVALGMIEVADFTSTAADTLLNASVGPVITSDATGTILVTKADSTGTE
ncbi:MAG: tetratricopeptide repeat protein [Candidatus Krumholzibacteria bacterium]|nr:tetratricopeptide repeat protein [Candidatus Krumholzibacteria bacterium]